MNSWKFQEGQKVEKISDDGKVIKVGEVTNVGSRFVLVKYDDNNEGSRVVENPKSLRPAKESELV